MWTATEWQELSTECYVTYLQQLNYQYQKALQERKPPPSMKIKITNVMLCNVQHYLKQVGTFNKTPWRGRTHLS